MGISSTNYHQQIFVFFFQLHSHDIFNDLLKSIFSTTIRMRWIQNNKNTEKPVHASARLNQEWEVIVDREHTVTVSHCNWNHWKTNGIVCMFLLFAVLFFHRLAVAYFDLREYYRINVSYVCVYWFFFCSVIGSIDHTHTMR